MLAPFRCQDVKTRSSWYSSNELYFIEFLFEALLRLPTLSCVSSCCNEGPVEQIEGQRVISDGLRIHQNSFEILAQ